MQQKQSSNIAEEKNSWWATEKALRPKDEESRMSGKQNKQKHN